MNKLTKICRRAGDITKHEGIGGLIKSGIRFVLTPVYQRTDFCLFEYVIAEDILKHEPHKARAENITFHAVSSMQEADELEEKGMAFRKYPADFNYGLMTFTYWLERGAIACCTFVGNEFAGVMWIIPTQKIQDSINTLPLKIDYDKHEAFVRGAWVNPKFRGLGIYGFTVNNRDRFAAKLGIRKVKHTVDVKNKPGLNLMVVNGSRQYGTACMKKSLWKTTWEEELDQSQEASPLREMAVKTAK